MSIERSSSSSSSSSILPSFCEKNEALVISSSSADVGILCWDFLRNRKEEEEEEDNEGVKCACPRHGLVLLGRNLFASSQIQRTGSVGSGEIFFWALHKVQIERKYPVEPIIPLTCTCNGIYVVGGSISGKIYLWEVSSWTLLAIWAAHHKGVSCLVFSHDDSLLISGSDDGTVLVWPLIRILDRSAEELQMASSSMPKLFLYRWSGHRAPVSAVVVSAGVSDAVVVSASLDQTCKVWGLGLGKLLQSIQLQSAITSAVLHPTVNLLYIGTTTGSIFICILHPYYSSTREMNELIAHSCSVTALTISTDGRYLISGSEDKVVRVWGIPCGDFIQELHIKGPVSNLLMIPRYYLSKDASNYRTFHGAQLSSIKISKTESFFLIDDPTVLLGVSTTDDEKRVIFSAKALNEQLIDLKVESTCAALGMKTTILKEKNTRAFKINEEYLQQVELLKALYAELRLPNN